MPLQLEMNREKKKKKLLDQNAMYHFGRVLVLTAPMQPNVQHRKKFIVFNCTKL